MKLYLIQHGNALDKDLDPDRHLSEQGARDLRKIAGFINHLDICAQVWHSGKTRAEQTAGILAEAMSVKDGISQKEGLSPNDDVSKIKDTIESSGQDIMIVGHLPFLGKLASLLIAGDEVKNSVAFKQGGIVCLECDDDKQWYLGWMIIPEIIV